MKFGNLLIRSISAVIFAGLALSSIFAGKLCAFIVFGFFLSIILIEYKNFSSFKNFINITIYVFLGIIFYILGVWGNSALSMKQWGALIILFLVALLMILAQKNMSFTGFVKKISVFFYVTVPFIMFIHFFDFSEKMFNNYYLLPTIFILLIWIGDTFAYFCGRLFGKHKMAQKISPSKTWEGFAGGAFAVILSMILFQYIKQTSYSYVFWIAFAIITYFFGTLGDLNESAMKRRAELKDSGKIIPGHGGAFDRFDSFILAVPMITLLLLSTYI